MSVTFRVAPSSAPSAASSASNNGYSSGCTPVPTPTTADAICTASMSSSRAASRCRTRPAARMTISRSSIVDGDRGSSTASMPGRTVAICTGEVAVIAATNRPPNAGFHPTSRPSRTSRSTASPVRPAPSRAATRDATSRPHIVPGASRAHGGADSAHVAIAPATSSSTGEPVSRTTRSAPQADAVAVSSVGNALIALTEPPIRAARRAAEPSSSRATRGRAGSRTTATTGPEPSREPEAGTH